MENGNQISQPTPPPTGRFAPSPTGRMHLGNVYAALLSWLSVRSHGGRWILRIEDLDPQRSRPEYARQIEDDLRWLGLDWDEGGLDGLGDHGPYVQSRRGEFYAEALRQLDKTGRLYPCTCTRADIMASQAPHQSDGRIIYSRHCLPARLGGSATGSGGRPAALRLFVGDEAVDFDDVVCGPQHVDLASTCGDFVVRRADGAWAYQLAVVVDDALMGVTEVARGNDLLLSAAQQIYLYRLLGHTPPRFAHFPLLVNAEGRRLSKRDRSLSLAELRRDFTAPQLLGHLAKVIGLGDTDAPVTAVELLQGFSFAKLPQSPAIAIG